MPFPADLQKGLLRSPKHLPCRFLYNDLGSQLYEQITQLDEYYPYRTEQALLRRHAANIARQLPRNCIVVELGCGDSTKTAILLETLLNEQDSSGAGAESCGVRFCGIDCSAEALRQTQRALRRLLPQLAEEQVELVQGEYLAGVAEVRRRHPDATLALLWLGSSVGNFSSTEAAEFLGALRSQAGENSQLLLCTDLWKDERVLRCAYHDSKGVTEAFILNGMHHALATLKHPFAYRQGLWRYEVVINRNSQQVEMYVVAQDRVADLLPGVDIERGERVLIEISRKFTPESIAVMTQAAGWCLGGGWGNSLYRMSLLLTPQLALRQCWQDTDSMYSNILDWDAQPIELRRHFAFYYGHVTSFTKSRLLPQEEATELDVMMSRGIDPNVLDPNQCHSHPEVPPQWPTKQELLDYTANTRQQMLTALQHGMRCDSIATGAAGPAAGGVSMRALVMVLEHERMHQETLCYMLAQQRKADAAAAAAGQPVALAPGVTAAHGNAPMEDGTGLCNGLSHTKYDVVPFYLQQCRYSSASLAAHTGTSQNGDAPGSPITGLAAPSQPGTPAQADRIAEQMSTLHLPSIAALEDAPAAEKPAALDGFVHVPGGQVRLGVDPAGAHAFLWDCELGRLGPLAVPDLLVAAAPITVAQFRRFVFEDEGYKRPELWEGDAYAHLQASGHTMPATWSLLGAGPAQQLWVHMPEGSYRWEDVADCPVYVSQVEALAYCKLYGGRLMTEAEWEHAVASQAAASGTIQHLESGGWEWTATTFEPLPGFTADKMYPEFAADFFDGQHTVVRGSSQYTHPSTARQTFRNWYQPLYPFVFAKFRLVCDPN